MPPSRGVLRQRRQIRPRELLQPRGSPSPRLNRGFLLRHRFLRLLRGRFGMPSRFSRPGNRSLLVRFRPLLRPLRSGPRRQPRHRPLLLDRLRFVHRRDSPSRLRFGPPRRLRHVVPRPSGPRRRLVPADRTTRLPNPLSLTRQRLSHIAHPGTVLLKRLRNDVRPRVTRRTALSFIRLRCPITARLRRSPARPTLGLRLRRTTADGPSSMRFRCPVPRLTRSESIRHTGPPLMRSRVAAGHERLRQVDPRVATTARSGAVRFDLVLERLRLGRRFRTLRLEARHLLSAQLSRTAAIRSGTVQPSADRAVRAGSPVGAVGLRGPVRRRPATLGGSRVEHPVHEFGRALRNVDHRLLRSEQLSRFLAIAVLGFRTGRNEPLLVVQRAHPGRLRGERDAFEQHLAAEQRLQALAERSHFGTQRIQFFARLRLRGLARFRLEFEFVLPPGRDLAFQLEFVYRLRLGDRVLAVHRVLAGPDSQEGADQGSPERRDDAEPEVPEVVAEHQCEGGADGEEQSDDKPRPARAAAMRVVTHASHA